MESRIPALIQKLNISPTAAKVYCALLELGKATADRIAKRAKTYKPNTYDALEKLSALGLATYLYEENKKFFIPTNPEKLPQIVEDIKEKEVQRVEELKKEILEFMPELKAAYASIQQKEIFEVYRGRKAYKAMMNEIVNENPQSWKGFGNLQVQEFFPIEFQRWFKHIPLLLFSNKKPEVLKRLQEAKRVTKVEIVWLPKDVYMPIVWVLFGENLLIIIYEPEIIVMRIKSDQVTKTFLHQFDYLWKKHS